MAPLWGLFAFVSSFIPYLGVTAMTFALLCAGLMTHDALVLALHRPPPSFSCIWSWKTW